MNSSPQSRLSELAQLIAKNTSIVEKYYHGRGITMPSFEPGSPVDTIIEDDPNIERARIAVIEASIELKDLLEGPRMQVRPYLSNTSLQAVYKFDIPSKVPSEGDISYEELAKLCNLDSEILRRLVRFAIAHHRVFRETQEGFVSHSAASKLLADDEDAMACLGFQFDECHHAFADTVEALQKYPTQTPTQCGWTLSKNINSTIWEYSAQNPDHGARVGKTMRQIGKGFGHDTLSLLRGRDWASINDRPGGAHIVDVGGGNGHASILLARQHPNLRFEVQDLPEVIDAAQSEIPSDLKERVTLKTHDFKQPQPTEADVYLLRQILHDWPDADCIKILQALVPALRPGVRIVLNDFVVPAPGVLSPLPERHIRSIDLAVMSLFGSKEREERDWKKLFSEADPRFIDISTYQPDGCCMAIIEATWSG